MQLPYFSADQFKAKAQGDALPAEYAVRKQFIAEVKSDDESQRRLSFTISSESVDRDSDKIAVDGWDLKNYKKNPVILWAHDYRSLPVGRSVRVWAEEPRLKSVAEFASAELSPFADQVYRFYKEGFLSAVSVGFAPKKWAFTEESSRKFGVDFLEQELLEYSAVPVPANADALVEARSAGLDVVPILEWATRTMRDLAPEIVTERDLEGLLRDAGGLSKKAAQAIVSRGFRGLRDSAPTGTEVASSDAKELLRAARKALGLN